MIGELKQLRLSGCVFKFSMSRLFQQQIRKITYIKKKNIFIKALRLCDEHIIEN